MDVFKFNMCGALFLIIKSAHVNAFWLFSPTFLIKLFIAAITVKETLYFPTVALNDGGAWNSRYWLDPYTGGVYFNNCYNFATGKKTNSWAQPGSHDFRYRDIKDTKFSCTQMDERVLHDGLENSSRNQYFGQFYAAITPKLLMSS